MAAEVGKFSPHFTRREFTTLFALTLVGTGVGLVAQQFGIPDLGCESPDVSFYTNQQLKDIAFYDRVPNCEYRTSIVFISPRVFGPGTITTAIVRNNEGMTEYALGLGEIGDDPAVEAYDSASKLTDALLKRWRDIAHTEGHVQVSSQATVLLDENDTATILGALDTTIVDHIVTWSYWDIQAAIKIYGTIAKGRVTREAYLVLELLEKEGNDSLTAIIMPTMQYQLGTLATVFDDNDPASQRFSMRTHGIVSDTSAIAALRGLVSQYTTP